MIVGGYSMDLYCRHMAPVNAALHDAAGHMYDAFPRQFTDRTFAGCKRQAKKEGWRFHNDGEVTCPQCIKKGKRK